MLNGLNHHMDTAEESEDGKTCRLSEEQVGSMSAKSGEGTCVSQDPECGPCRRPHLGGSRPRRRSPASTPTGSPLGARHRSANCCAHSGALLPESWQPWSQEAGHARSRAEDTTPRGRNERLTDSSARTKSAVGRAGSPACAGFPVLA
uniref:Uncharacterized protein n=1 Tax=Pipistrellus kuhlii TaxID=59472 RepID=A0A7J7SF38_PIPKU|nr:hypothetical protein mPipKuh1_010009 [Pipistrellus kuhlii]